MPFILVQGDLTERKVDAIVNAANTHLVEGSGVCGAIFQKAGSEQLQKACELLSPVETGNVVITPAFNLPSKFVIHAVGPIWHGGHKGEDALLRACYTNALHLAKEKKLTSIAFPLISAGIYGYPKYRAYRIAVTTILEFLEMSEMNVSLVLFNESFITTHEKDEELDTYVKQHQLLTIEEEMETYICNSRTSSFLDLLDIKEESFSSRLFRLIEEKHLDEVTVYKGANIDRKHFSKIRSNDSYQPNKRTVIAFAISLHLSEKEAKDLLQSAGYSLSHSYTFDIIIEYFLKKGRYDIHDINEFLFTYNQPILGG
jgi:O-acetyl-ADP-ribose deacetylase (regulator of RNase III)